MSHNGIDTSDRDVTDRSTAAEPTALVVIAHHRSDSLTAHIARRTIQRLESTGHKVDVLDLRAEDFDPRMTAADQPDWGNRDKPYSPEVHAQMDRVLAADLIVAVFPVYWASVPALLKGWIDRVWNYGFAYGRSRPRLAGKRMLWLGLAGVAAADPVVDFLQQSLEGQLNMGIAYYCGLEFSTVGLLPDAEERRQRLNSDGTLQIDEATVGAERVAQYTALEQRAEEFLTDFLTATPVLA
ncbi:NAD(P)H oxidoreductase [Nocardia sp. NBC_00511]|uniref:NAD(P)H oxidoreductase n=1 Tax=Nocardia sp. NBC_00511 TaxID=2903591 RepID=UPI0030E1BB1B